MMASPIAMKVTFLDMTSWIVDVFSTHLLESLSDIRIVRELLGQAKCESPMNDIHFTKQPGLGVRSPRD